MSYITIGITQSKGLINSIYVHVSYIPFTTYSCDICPNILIRNWAIISKYSTSSYLPRWLLQLLLTYLEPTTSLVYKSCGLFTMIIVSTPMSVTGLVPRQTQFGMSWPIVITTLPCDMLPPVVR